LTYRLCSLYIAHANNHVTWIMIFVANQFFLSSSFRTAREMFFCINRTYSQKRLKYSLKKLLIKLLPKVIDWLLCFKTNVHCTLWTIIIPRACIVYCSQCYLFRRRYWINGYILFSWFCMVRYIFQFKLWREFLTIGNTRGVERRHSNLFPSSSHRNLGNEILNVKKIGKNTYSNIKDDTGNKKNRRGVPIYYSNDDLRVRMCFKFVMCVCVLMCR